MIKEYSISDILSVPSKYIPYYIGAFENMEDPYIEWPHRHSFYSIVWFTKGNGFYVVDSVEYEIKPNRIFFMEPKQLHNWDYSDNSRGYTVIIDHSPGLAMNIDHSYPYIDIDQSEILLHEALLKNLIAESEQNDTLSEFSIKAGIQYYSLLLQRTAKRKNIKKHPNDPILDRFKFYILSDYSKSESIKYYAEKLKISVTKINELCKNTLGISAKQYLLDLKITEAKRLLIYSKQNINEISFHTGFEDSSYFARIFRKKTTLSPTDFLKKYRKHS